MIALDTSSILAVLLNEPEGESFSRFIAGHVAMVGAPTIVEARLALERKAALWADSLIAGFVGRRSVSVLPFDMGMVDVALSAFARFGKGRGHPAQLNFGDCLSYAVARSRNLPLLFKGDDFRRTDLVPAYDPAL